MFEDTPEEVAAIKTACQEFVLGASAFLWYDGEVVYLNWPFKGVRMGDVNTPEEEALPDSTS